MSVPVPPTPSRFRAWMTRLEDLEECVHRRLKKQEVDEINRLRELVERWQFRRDEFVAEDAVASCG